MDSMLTGAVAAGSLVAGLIFFRFWRHTQDRFFLYFTASFWIEAFNRVVLELLLEASERSPIFYGVRVLAYGLILVAIWQKNRRRS